jgi:AAA ATPase domain
MTRQPADSVLGREPELDEIERFLDVVEGGASRLLVLSGPAGIGKTTIWTAGIRAAGKRGFQVVSVGPRPGRPQVGPGMGSPLSGDVSELALTTTWQANQESRFR